ncbi:MAG TPA: CsiV family protein [Gammaproteobacteria bacterium]|nr:CsiV family protein [Gammaproteobacteria bacterium]
MKSIRIAVASIMALTTAGTAFAQQPGKQPEQHWFAVEVIVFRPTTNMAGGNEMWPADPKLPSLKKAVVPAVPEPASTQPATGMATFALPSTTATPTVAAVKPEGDLVLPLPTTQYQLQGVWNRLAQSGRYQPLIHTGWIEQGVPPRQAPKVSITPLVMPESMSLPVSANLPVSTTLPTATTVFSDNTLAPAPASSQQPVATNVTAPDEKTAPPTAPAFGTIKLSYNRFLHLALNIAYRPVNPAALRTWRSKDDEFATPSPATTTPAPFTGFGPYFSPQPPKPQAIVMHESRRISPKTINYFDNPLFGVIVQVTPVEPPAAATAPAPAH